MTPYRFLHSSDLHLGKPFGRFPEGIRHRLREARHGAIGRLAAAARSGGAATILLAGDTFDAEPPAPPKFYEQPWFASIVRIVAALLAVVMVLLLGIRPLVAALRPQPQSPASAGEAAAGEDDAGEDDAVEPLPPEPQLIEEITDPVTGRINTEALSRHVGLAQALIEDKPENAVLALRQMLQSEENGAA